jgi:hypothetical protein
MPQAALTNGELFKKTLRTTLVMVGSTALWLGALTGAVVLTTGSTASGQAESKNEKPEKAAGAAPATVPGAAQPKGPGGVMGLKSMHRSSPAGLKADPPRPGDPI